MRGFLLLLLVVVAPAFADIGAGTPLYNWIQPTQWSDGSPLVAAQITGYQLNCTGAATVSRRVVTASGVPPFQTPNSEKYAPGSYTCTLAVYAKQTTTSAEVMSGPSNPVSFTVPQPKPGAATGLSVE